MTISKAAYAISNARLTGMRAELVSLMLQRGKLDEEGQSEATARIRELLPQINELAAKLAAC